MTQALFGKRMVIEICISLGYLKFDYWPTAIGIYYIHTGK